MCVCVCHVYIYSFLQELGVPPNAMLGGKLSQLFITVSEEMRASCTACFFAHQRGMAAEMLTNATQPSIFRMLVEQGGDDCWSGGMYMQLAAIWHWYCETQVS